MLDYIDEQPRSDFQDALLVDGELTEEEYVYAFRECEKCVRAAGGGFIPDPPKRNERGTFISMVAYEDGPPVQGNPFGKGPIGVAVDECKSQYFDRVGEWWGLEHQPAKAEVDAALEGIAVCMRESGVPIPEWIDLDRKGWGSELMARAEEVPQETGIAFRDCSLAAGKELGDGPGIAPIP